MSEFQARFTDDGSVGLYSNDVDDIYHSDFGALSEAYEKFIFPAKLNEFLNNNNKIKILDVCFGIGYNSKAFLNFYLNFLHEKNNCINSIYTNNIYASKNHELILHGVEIDKNLLKLSPFIKQIKNYKSIRNKNIFSDKNFINNNNFYICDEINIILLLKLFEKYKENYIDNDLLQILDKKANKKFFNQNLAYFIKSYPLRGYKLSLNEYILTFLHNIYYKYISNSYKNSLKVLENRNFNIELFDTDARAFIKATNLKYDFVFLDAFTPTKLPTLWTVEFFNQLYNHTSENCMILTYSNSALVRNAFIQNNFYVGKIYNKYENKFTGTIAVKNKSLLDYPLDEFDIGLLNTKAGICFHDNIDLSLTESEIINNRNFEVQRSKLISATQYKKEQKCHTM